MEVLFALIYFGLAVGFASWAKSYNRTPVGWFLFFVLNPFFATIVLLLVGRVKKNKFCPECGKETDPDTFICSACNIATDQSRQQSEDELSAKREPTLHFSETPESQVQDSQSRGVFAIIPDEFSLDFDKVVEFIEDKKPFVENSGNIPTELLSNFSIVDYKSNLHIEPIKVNGVTRHLDAQSYFSNKGYQYLFDFDPSSAHNKTEENFAEIYRTTRKFQYPFKLCFFDGFFVIEIQLSAQQLEFLVLAPRQQPEYQELEMIGGLFAKVQVSELSEILSTSQKNLCIFGLLVDSILVELAPDSSPIKK